MTAEPRCPRLREIWDRIRWWTTLVRCDIAAFDLDQYYWLERACLLLDCTDRMLHRALGLKDRAYVMFRELRKRDPDAPALGVVRQAFEFTQREKRLHLIALARLPATDRRQCRYGSAHDLAGLALRARVSTETIRSVIDKYERNVQLWRNVRRAERSIA